MTPIILLKYVEETDGAVTRYFFVHGEKDQAVALAEAVRAMTGRNAEVPRRGETVE
ncbi:MAG: hypothetical protein NTX71_07340 [Candidatus Aureabacteria bacterium]|nr:hypothetical protein [Candidatus Auribacterota bacterium]